MNRIQFFGLIGFLLYFSCYVCATLKINRIIGPESVEKNSTDYLVLDCDFEAGGEEEVVLKWFYNGLEEPIYQWISSTDQAYAMGHLKDVIDTTYKVSDNPHTMLRALKFKEVSPALSGNYTCKVSSDYSDAVMTKQVIVYSNATSFNLVLIGGDDKFAGNEVVVCNVADVSPRPSFDLYIVEANGSLGMPDMFAPDKKEVPNDDGSYNISITLPFNSSYLVERTTFVCQLSIPGTNYSENKTVEHGEGNGKLHLQSPLLTVVFLLFSLVLAT